MGNLLEVEPDVLLATYLNSDRKKPLLYQFIRSTAKGIEPVAQQNRK